MFTDNYWQLVLSPYGSIYYPSEFYKEVTLDHSPINLFTCSLFQKGVAFFVVVAVVVFFFASLLLSQPVWNLSLTSNLYIQYIFCCLFGKKCHNTHRKLLVSDVVWEYRKISVFSHHAFLFRSVKIFTLSLSFAQSVMLCPDWCVKLRSSAAGDGGMSWLAVALRSVSRIKLELKQTSLLCWNFTCNRFISLWIFGADWPQKRERQ